MLRYLTQDSPLCKPELHLPQNHTLESSGHVNSDSVNPPAQSPTPAETAAYPSSHPKETPSARIASLPSQVAHVNLCQACCMARRQEGEAMDLHQLCGVPNPANYQNILHLAGGGLTADFRAG